MATKFTIPFNLDAFKAGQKALTRDGRTATFIGICEGCEEFSRLLVLLEGDDQVMFFSLNGKFEQSTGTYNETRYDLVSMVSRHQRLIDSYDPEDTWQWSRIGKNAWAADATPSWDEKLDYRLHPHNDLIKAWKKGAKIEKLAGEFGKGYVDDLNPTWEEYGCYRIKPEPTTKTVYEWMYMLQGMKHFEFIAFADGDTIEYDEPPMFAMKTGRSWEVEEYV